MVRGICQVAISIVNEQKIANVQLQHDHVSILIHIHQFTVTYYDAFHVFTPKFYIEIAGNLFCFLKVFFSFFKCHVLYNPPTQTQI